MEKCPRSVHRGFKTAVSSWSHSTVVLVYLLLKNFKKIHGKQLKLHTSQARKMSRMSESTFGQMCSVRGQRIEIIAKIFMVFGRGKYIQVRLILKKRHGGKYLLIGENI